MPKYKIFQSEFEKDDLVDEILNFVQDLQKKKNMSTLKFSEHFRIDFTFNCKIQFLKISSFENFKKYSNKI